MKKKQLCMIVAAMVSVCLVVSLVSTGIGVLSAMQSGGEIPTGMVMLTLVTGVCTYMIWKGIREME